MSRDTDLVPDLAVRARRLSGPARAAHRVVPRTAVVFAGDAGCPSVDRCCGYISFFTTGRAARAWARRHPEITGTVLRRDGALRIGIQTFRGLLQPARSDPAGENQ